MSLGDWWGSRSAERRASHFGDLLWTLLSASGLIGFVRPWPLRLLRKPLDDAIEPLVHAAQLGAQAVERSRVVHFGGGEVLVVGAIAGKLDA